jgi:hypothetical protein
MKGMKAVEYKIWARSYYKDKGNYINLSKVRDILRKMKTKFLEISYFDR